MKFLFIIRIFFIIIFFYNLSSSNTLEKVTLQLHWKYQFEFAGFIAAKEKGFYKDVGLDVELKEFQFGTNIEDEVLSGKANYGIYNSGLLRSYLKGKPIKLMASFFKRSALVLITKPNIKSILDLKDKIIMAGNKQDFDMNFKYLFNEEGINTADLHLIPHTYSLKDFIDGKCDAITAFISDQPYKLDKLGVKYNIIDPSKYGIYNLQLELFTSKREFLDYPQRTENFKNASIKGWKYALAHKQELIKIIKTKYNNSLSYDFLNNESKQTELLILPKIYEIGSIDKSFLQKQMELFKQEDDIDKTKSLNDIFCNINNIMISLTHQEKIYLKKKKTITVCVKKRWLPYEGIDDDGKFIGISADFLRLYTKKLDLNIDVIPVKNQIESLKYFDKKRCDIKPLLVTSTKKTIPYSATVSYFKDNISLVTRLEQGYIRHLKDVHQTLLMAKGYKKLIFYIQEKYPNIKLKIVDDTKTALKLVANSQAYGYIGTSLTSSYIIQKEFSSKLKIVNSFKDIYFGFGVVDDNKILKEILNKAIKTTLTDEKTTIFNKWVATTIQKSIDYTQFWQIFFVLIVIFGFMIYRSILSAKHNKELQKKIAQALEQNNLQNQQMIQQSRLAQMGEMLSMIAHQWRQPLGAITARTGSLSLQLMLHNHIDPKELEEELGKINDYAQYLSNTINDFRDFFKNDKELQNTTIETIVQSTLDIIQVSIESKNIDIVLDLKCNKEFQVLANEVKQVILNILKNAEDILLEKDIQNPIIKIYSICENNQEPILYIEDNAGGVPKDIIDKIFDPYFSTKIEKDGTGLGLYMSKTIIDDHCKGKLTVSNGEYGAIFKIDFNKIGGGNTRCMI